jgi:preprotein translocase subunit SecA
MRELERRVVLSVLDRKWREHLYEMDYLQEGIGLRAMAQRDPLVEYQREGFQLFNAMNEAIKEESVGYVFNLEVEVEPVVEEAAEEEPGAGEEHPHIVAKGLQPPSRPAQLQYTAPSVDGEGGVEVREESTDGRSGGSESASGAGNGSGNGSRADRRSAARSAKKARRR